jgi:hypothetical protein
MGVFITDSTNDERYLKRNWWSWRPTVEAIRSLHLFEDERLNVMSDGYGSFSENECKLIADELEQKVLPKLKPDERMKLDGSVTDVPDDGTFYREPEEQDKNYSVNRDLLAEFIVFCRESKGVIIG